MEVVRDGGRETTPGGHPVVRSAGPGRSADCRPEKNWSLIRSDIIQSLGEVHHHTGDDAIRATADSLIASEDDDGYRAKYAKVWRQSQA